MRHLNNGVTSVNFQFQIYEEFIFQFLQFRKRSGKLSQFIFILSFYATLLWISSVGIWFSILLMLMFAQCILKFMKIDRNNRIVSLWGKKEVNFFFFSSHLSEMNPLNIVLTYTMVRFYFPNTMKNVGVV